VVRSSSPPAVALRLSGSCIVRRTNWTQPAAFLLSVILTSFIYRRFILRDVSEHSMKLLAVSIRKAASQAREELVRGNVTGALAWLDQILAAMERQQAPRLK
jgi:hypothetical protein